MVVVSIDAASGNMANGNPTSFQFVSLVDNHFTTPHYDADLSMTAYAIDGTNHEARQILSGTLAAVTASTPTTVTIENLYT